jgi:hypothetical protein
MAPLTRPASLAGHVLGGRSFFSYILTTCLARPFAPGLPE